MIHPASIVAFHCAFRTTRSFMCKHDDADSTRGENSATLCHRSLHRCLKIASVFTLYFINDAFVSFRCELFSEVCEE